MAGIDQVVELLTELRDSRGVLGRASVLARGAAAMRDLTAQQKRELAVEVARRAAPQLVPRIEAETGMDLTPAQVSAVMDLALRWERHDLDELIATLSSDGARAQVGREVVGAVGRELDEELDLGLLPPPPPARVATDGDEAATPDPAFAPSSAPADAETDAPADTPVAADDLGDDLEDDPEIAELRAELEATRREIGELQELGASVTEDLAGIADEAVAAVRDEAPTEPRVGDAAPEADESGQDDLLAAGAAAMTAAAMDQRAAVDQLTSPAEAADDEARHTANDPEAAARGRAAVERVRRAGSAGAALRAITRDPEALRHAGSDGRATAIRAVPDGWARRRSVQRLVEAGVVTEAEAVPLVRLLGRESDRVWVLGTMIDVHLIDAQAADGLVSDRAVARLAARR